MSALLLIAAINSLEYNELKKKDKDHLDAMIASLTIMANGEQFGDPVRDTSIAKLHEFAAIEEEEFEKMKVAIRAKHDAVINQYKEYLQLLKKPSDQYPDSFTSMGYEWTKGPDGDYEPRGPQKKT